MDRQVLYERINKRVDDMLEEGLVDEARRLLPYRSLTPLKTVGYKELFQYFDKEISLEESIEQIKNHSRAYARRQLTWFRKDKSIQWFEPTAMNEILDWIKIQLN